VVDEAWCVDLRGRALWGVKLPLQKRWIRSAPPSDGGGINSAVQSALGLLNLSLPLTPAQLKQRYRELAMRWHPDHNLAARRHKSR
jgi:hypothetical protein